MGGSAKGRQQRTGRIEGREGGGQEGRQGAGLPPTTEGGEDGGQMNQREGGKGNGDGLGGWEPGAPCVCPAIGAM